jgi:hypothetical protein
MAEASSGPLEADAIWSMSPEEAGAVLDARAADFHSPAPLSPSTPAEADARLAQLINDPEWARKLLAGDGATRDEFQRLSELKASGSVGDAIVDETAIVETTIGAEELTRRDTIAAAAVLRNAGMPDQAIEAVFTGQTFPPSDVHAARVLRDRCMRNPVFVDAYLKGDPEATYTMLVYNSILSAGTGEA